MHRLDTHARTELGNIKSYVIERTQFMLPNEDLALLLDTIDRIFLDAYLRYGSTNYLTV